MALKQLAGPFPMRYEGDADQPAYFLHHPQWIEGKGLMGDVFYRDAGGTLRDGEFCIVQLNGEAWTRNDNPSLFAMGDLTLDLESDDLIRLRYGFNNLDRVSPITGSFQSELTPDGVLMMARLPDRNLAVIGDTVYGYDHGTNDQSDPSQTLEATLSGNPGFPTLFSRGPGGSLYISSGDDGRLYQYNYLTQTEVGTLKTIGMSNEGIVYLPEYGIFVSLHALSSPKRHELRIWANEPEPMNLTAPAATPAPTKGISSLVEVQILGDAGEPCVGFLVDWTLTGDGNLTASQSKTDSTGTAATRYVAPVDSLPAITLGAEVVL